MQGKHSVTWLLWDTAFLIILCSLSLFLISPYFRANFLVIGYPDWLVHAYRVKFLDTYGLASWTHNWSNGINIWQSYQFIPHVITLCVAKIAGVAVPRAMILTTIGLFIALRIFIYTVLRALQFSPFTAFLCAVLTFDISSYWGGVRDYSILFGFTFFPLIVYLWVQYSRGKLQLVFPYLLGLLFYVHPMIAIASISLWAVGIVLSNKHVFSLTTIVHFIIILASSSLFWFPIIFKLSYTHSASDLATKYFLTMVLNGFEFLGLSLFVLGSFFLGFINLFLKTPKWFRWNKVFFVFTALYFSLVVLALNVDLPKFISQFQFTRGMTIVGIAMIFTVAPFIERIKKQEKAILKYLTVFFISLAFVDGMWFASIHSPPFTNNMPDMVSDYTIHHAHTDVPKNRMYTSTIGESSYGTLTDSRFVNSYNYHLEPNLTSSRVAQLFSNESQFDNLPDESVQRLEDYIRLTGTKYVFLDDTYGSKKFSTLKMFDTLGTFSMKEYQYQVFAYPDEIRDATLIDKKFTNTMEHFPFTLETSTVDDQLKLDSYVKKFVSTIYSQENTNLAITYPSPTTMQIGIPANRSTNLVYINESHDIGWKAFFNNREQKISATGPNYILVTLDNTKEQGILVLRHSWPISFYVSTFIIALIPVEILLLTCWNFLLNARKKNKFAIEKL